MKITVIRPSRAHGAYAVAAETFASLAEKVCGTKCDIITDSDALPEGTSPVAVIGTDAANGYSADLWLTRKIDGFRVRYNTEDLAVFTADIGGRRHLFFSGGRPRAVIYAVYRYFELCCGCRWFWDGDRLPSLGELPLDGVDIAETPRFEWRGLRYFAHRSLHRFQAEHWSLADWQAEIDWMLKKRLNMFMLRIGLDDLFQKAFPDIVPYPDRDRPLPEAGGGYDDRSLFWSLEYRGELRKKLLAYAFERDLIHPEDCGTMTHWYSRTPISYLQAVKPKTLDQKSGGYAEATGKVWDIRDDDNLEAYFRLTETHIREYGRPEVFHTIGLAERSFSDDREDNMRLKLYVYRRISSYIAEKYPNAPLMLASWDLWMFYSPDEVKRLLAEMDPKRTILLDYTSDTMRESNFTSWGVMGKFPWIFGIFGGYEPNSEIRGFYELTSERLRLAAKDPMCKGLILWPELSHGDTLTTEYLARSAWDGGELSVDETVERFCEDRYLPADRDRMLAIWRDILPIIQLRHWSVTKDCGHTGSDTFVIIADRARFDGKPSAFAWRSSGPAAELQERAAGALRALAAIAGEGMPDAMTRRDIFDIGRTVLGRYIDFAIRLAEELYASRDRRALAAMDAAEGLMEALADLLGGHEDYSMYETLKGLRAVTEVNPGFELTLKHNAENGYCRAYIYENAEYLYLPEMRILFGAVRASLESGDEIDREKVKSGIRENTRVFYDTPLEVMDAEEKADPAAVLAKAAGIISGIDFGA